MAVRATGGGEFNAKTQRRKDAKQRFVEIEEGHRAIVQAEIDCVSGLGFWFDTAEFKLEAG